jgi:hypothetical protein
VIRRSSFAALERPLTRVEHGRYGPYFSAGVLASARVVDGKVPRWLRPDMCGVTLGSRIHFRAGAYDANTAAGIELLAHELVHVRQFFEGMTVAAYVWACRRGYRRNRFEVEAYAVAARIRAEIHSLPLDAGGVRIDSLLLDGRREGEEVKALDTCGSTGAFTPLPNPLRQGEGAMQVKRLSSSPPSI